MRRITLRFFACLVLSVVFVSYQGTTYAATARAQLPHVTCSGNGCNNTDPYATGCASTAVISSTKHITHVVAGDAYVWLVYSPACGTNWTELDTTYDDHVEYFYGQINRAAGSDGGALSFAASSGQYKWFNSNQVYSPHNQAQACGAAGNSAVNCTGFI